MMAHRLVAIRPPHGNELSQCLLAVPRIDFNQCSDYWQGLSLLEEQILKVLHMVIDTG